MKKNFARAAVATGAAAGMLLSSSVVAFAADTTDSTTLEVATKNIRIWGPSRAETSVNAVQRLEEANAAANEAQEVYLVGGKAFADPLALTTLSDCTNSPVLMTQGPNDLPKTVAAKLKAIGPAAVTIVGGPLSVSDAVKDKVQALLPDAKVTRVAGATRYDTSYDIAAYTAACYNDAYADLKLAREAVAEIEAAEGVYKQAMKDYEAARSKYAAEESKLDALQAKAVAAAKAILDVTKGIKDGGNFKEAHDALHAATDKAKAANAAVEAQKDANDFITGVVSNKSVEGSTLNIKSTLQDYADYFQAKGMDKELKALKEAVATIGAEMTATVEDTIAMSNDKVAEAKVAADAAGLEVSEWAKKTVDAYNAAQANKELAMKAAKLQKAYADAMDAVEKQQVAVEKAQDALDEAKQALVDALAARPDGKAVVKAKAALRAALDASVAGAGASTVFLADGTRFPDALVGGPAAAQTKGVILLTQGAALPAATDKYLKASKAQVVTVGVPAAKAVKGDRVITLKEEFSGATRYDTAAAITKYYFGMGADANHEADFNAHPIAVASGEQFADAVLASNFIAQFDGAVLLTQKNNVPVPTLNYLNLFSKKDLPIRLFGGQMWASDGVMATLQTYAGR